MIHPRNAWDEICVQVQGKESVVWDTYLETIRSFIHHEIEKLDIQTKHAVWLQIDVGMDWKTDSEHKNVPTFCMDDIVKYILNGFVLPEAGNWTNRRIKRTLKKNSTNTQHECSGLVTLKADFAVIGCCEPFIRARMAKKWFLRVSITGR